MGKKNTHSTKLLELNLAMLFVSTSGALGRYTTLSVPVTIGIRALLALLLLLVYCKWKNISLRIKKKDRSLVVVSGLFMGLHWVTYFYSLRYSNVAIGMLSLFTYPVLTSFLEPIILGTKFQKIHLLLAILVLLGIYFLVPDFDLNSSYSIAVLLGILSALFYALRNLSLKSSVNTYHGTALMSYQLLVIAIILSPFFFFENSTSILLEWKPLLALALITTAIGHTLFLRSFKHFSITTASIISSIQPVYGIIIGALFLSEIPSLTTIFGSLLILSSVVIESIRSYG